jgi:uncharacterized membrane protein (UPF0127 family)
MLKSKFSLVLALISLLFYPQISLEYSYAQTAKFRTGYSLVADQLIPVEIAQTEAEREMGLSGRNFDKNNYRMVFVFENPKRVNFWMKNTKIDLSIAFIDKNNRINQIESLKANSLKTISSRSEQIKYAFEVPRGFFTKMDIKVGDEFLIFK